MSEFVQLDSVTKVYQGGVTGALNGVSLTIEEGEFAVVMGLSGSGKSTLLNLVAGLDRPSSGSVAVGKTEIDKLSEAGLARFRRDRVGLAFQFFNLLPNLTALENILLPAQLKGRNATSRAREDKAIRDLRRRRVQAAVVSVTALPAPPLPSTALIRPPRRPAKWGGGTSPINSKRSAGSIRLKARILAPCRVGRARSTGARTLTRLSTTGSGLGQGQDRRSAAY